MTRYIAEFSPQAWQRDQAIPVDPEGDTEWDATDFIVSALGAEDDHEWAERTISRGQDYDDILRQDPSAPEWIRDWRGPFDTYIRVVEP